MQNRRKTLMLVMGKREPSRKGAAVPGGGAAPGRRQELRLKYSSIIFLAPGNQSAF